MVGRKGELEEGTEEEKELPDNNTQELHWSFCFI